MGTNLQNVYLFPMKYIIYFIAAVIICGGCESKKDDNGNLLQKGAQVLTIKGCEFAVVVSNNWSIAMVHHPDCHNKIHSGISVTGDSNKIDVIYLDSNGVVSDTMSMKTGGGDYVDDSHLSQGVPSWSNGLGINQKPTKYRPGFTYYDKCGVKHTLKQWLYVGGANRWKCESEFLGVKAETWTDDEWIDVYTGKAYLDQQKLKIVYYDTTTIPTPITKYHRESWQPEVK